MAVAQREPSSEQLDLTTQDIVAALGLNLQQTLNFAKIKLCLCEIFYRDFNNLFDRRLSDVLAVNR